MTDDQIKSFREDLRTLFRAVDELRVAVTELKVSAELMNNSEQVREIDGRVKSLEALEQRRLGGGAVIGFLVGIIGTLLLSGLTWWLSKR